MRIDKLFKELEKYKRYTTELSDKLSKQSKRYTNVKNKNIELVRQSADTEIICKKQIQQSAKLAEES